MTKKTTPAPCGKTHTGSYTVETLQVCECEKRLWKAAPELLEAAKAELASRLDFEKRIGQFTVLTDEHKASVVRLRAAIARAEGR